MTLRLKPWVEEKLNAWSNVSYLLLHISINAYKCMWHALAILFLFVHHFIVFPLNEIKKVIFIWIRDIQHFNLPNKCDC